MKSDRWTRSLAALFLAGSGWSVMAETPAPAEQGTVIEVTPLPSTAPPQGRMGVLRRCKLWLQDCFLGYPSEFEPVPFGAALRANMTTMVANGEAARMVFYDYDFIPGTASLNHRGQEHLARIQQGLFKHNYPIIIEWCGPPGLADARRLALLRDLSTGGVAVSPQRVVTGPPIAVGMSGLESEIVYRNLLMQTQSAGISMSGGVSRSGNATPQAPPPAPVQP